MKRLFILFYLSLFVIMPPAAQAVNGSAVKVTPDAMIDGVSEFLIERAEANLIYMFEQKIKESDKFACYFPNTRARLQYGHLQEWLLAPGEIWGRTISRDMEIFAVRAVAINMERRFKLSQKATALANAWTTFSADFAIEFEGELFPLNVVPLPRGSRQAQIVNGFSNDLGDIVTALNVFRSYSATCESPDYDFDQFKQAVEGLLKIKDNIDAFRQHLQQHGAELRYTGDAVAEFCRDHDLGDCSTARDAADLFKAKVEKIVVDRFRPELMAQLEVKVDALKTEIEAGLEPELISEKAIAFLNRLEKDGGVDKTELYRLSRSVMFFAQLSDSKNKEDVKAVLKAYTLAPVSYYTKREPGSHLMLSAYLGITKDFNDDDPGNDEAGALFAPLGLEYSRGLGSGGSVSIMLAPFDFGYPVTLKLNGTEGSAKFDDVWAPSLSLAYGVADMPLTVGVGYQKGRFVQALNDSENRVLLFLAFDMPLWPLR